MPRRTRRARVSMERLTSYVSSSDFSHVFEDAIEAAGATSNTPPLTRHLFKSSGTYCPRLYDHPSARSTRNPVLIQWIPVTLSAPAAIVRSTGSVREECHGCREAGGPGGGSNSAIAASGGGPSERGRRGRPIFSSRPSAHRLA